MVRAAAATVASSTSSRFLNSKSLVEDCWQDNPSMASGDPGDLDASLHGSRSPFSQNAIEQDSRKLRKALIESFDLHGDTNHWWPNFRTTCGRLINAPWVQGFVVSLIVLDAIILGAITYEQVQENDVVFTILNAFDLAFLIVFNIEISLQVLYLGPYNLVCFAHWRLFDLMVIILSWVFFKGSLRALGVFRLFTAISKLDILRSLFAAIGKTMPRMASIWLVLIVFFYSFMVLFTSLFSNAYDEGYMEYDYFGNLKTTFLSLLQVMTLDSWSGLMRSLMESNSNAWIGFVIWIIITAFFFLNMLIAVICDSLREMAEIEARKREKKLMKNQNAMLKNQQRELRSELEKDRKIHEVILEQQQITQSLLLDVLKAVAPDSVGDKNAELRRRALAVNLPDFGFDQYDSEADAQTMQELEQMAALVKHRALHRTETS